MIGEPIEIFRLAKGFRRLAQKLVPLMFSITVYRNECSLTVYWGAVELFKVEITDKGLCREFFEWT